jgi:hypothetical protein
MVERVAYALRNFVVYGKDGGERERAPTDFELNMARAAIQAMREPTDQMGLGLGSDYRPGSHSARQIWQAMIDEALK